MVTTAIQHSCAMSCSLTKLPVVVRIADYGDGALVLFGLPQFYSSAHSPTLLFLAVCRHNLGSESGVVVEVSWAANLFDRK